MGERMNWEHGEHSGTITSPEEERGPVDIQWDGDCPDDWEEIEAAVEAAAADRLYGADDWLARRACSAVFVPVAAGKETWWEEIARLSWDLSDTRIHPTKKQGMDKDIGVFVPEIDLCSYAYDKRRDVTAKDIAALWPDAQWRRSMPRYSFEEDTVRDYTADIDGVLVRITNAERKPKPKKVDAFGACGPVRILR